MRSASPLPRFRWGEHRIALPVLSPVERPRQRGLLDQEVIDEQLATHVDIDDCRRRGQVRNAHRLARELPAVWGPSLRQDDPVVEQFTSCTLRYGGM